MRGRTRARIAAAGFGAAALLLAACSGGGGGANPGNQASAGGAGGEISMRGCTPQSELWPGNTNEVCGGNVYDAISAKLIHYNADNAAPENDIAESIDTTDNQHFDIKIKKGYKFSDGTEVKARNFVDAWNFVAAGANGQANSYFFSIFKGYADTQCGADSSGEPDCKGHPAKTDKLSGLKVVNDYEFTADTTEKVSNLPVRLGYTAFSPMTDKFLDDPADRNAQKKIPVGAGPFKVVSNTATDIILQKNPNYSGKYKPSIDKVDYKIYQDASAAYNDLLANNLDYTDEIPSDQLVGGAYKNDLPNRNLTRPQGTITYLTFSPNDPQLKDNLKLRQAISMAIDRQTIIKQVFIGTASPADGWVSPIVDGYKPGQCGEFCKFDPAKAKQLYQESGGYKGTLTMTYNADSPLNKPYSEAVANSIKNTLGINAVASSVPDFATFLDKLDNNEVKGIFRTGWQMDYPSIENFLAPIYGSGADSNYAGYKSKKFDDLITQAAAAQSNDQANALYQQAEAQLGQDMPTAPLWFAAAVVGWSDNVTNVKVTAFGTLDLTSIKRK